MWYLRLKRILIGASADRNGVYIVPVEAQQTELLYSYWSIYELKSVV